VNLCVFTLAVRQRSSSIVLPVSVSFEVEGQRTSKLLTLRPVFGFGRRGGSNRNLVAMSESINYTGFGSVVGRHLHFYPVPDCKANKPFAHLSGNVRENETIVRKRDAKHSTRKHRCDHPLQLDGFFRIHHVNFSLRYELHVPQKVFGAWLLKSIQDLAPIARERTLPAVRTRTLFARTRFVNGQSAAIKFVSVKRAHRGVGLCAIVHGNKRKPARFAREPIHHQMDFVDGAVLFEQIL
jgi:hypothetical protein